MRLLPCIPPQRVHFAGVNARPLVNMPLMAAHPSARLRAADRPPRRIFGNDEGKVRRRLREAAPDVIGMGE